MPYVIAPIPVPRAQGIETNDIRSCTMAVAARAMDILLRSLRLRPTIVSGTFGGAPRGRVCRALPGVFLPRIATRVVAGLPAFPSILLPDVH